MQKHQTHFIDYVFTKNKSSILALHTVLLSTVGLEPEWL